MSDIPNSLIEQLASTGADVVYLPRNARAPMSAPAVSELNAADPRVVAAASAYFESPDRFHGDSVSEATIKTEKPIHRMMVYLHAQGASAEDIAAQTGYTPAGIRTILKQPWARSRLVQLLNEFGKDAVAHFHKHQVMPSLEVLVEIRDDKRVAASARINAANSVLDRALGKATIHVQSDNVNRSVPADAARLDAELASVRKQLEAKGAAGTS